jgi:subtilisin family serine protease
MDGTLYVRVARTMPATQLPLGSDPDSLLAALAPWPGMQAVARQYGLSRIAHIFTLKNDTLQRTYVCTFADHAGILACMEALQALPYVELAERRPLYRVSHTPNDPTINLWHLQKIRAFEAWDLATGSSTVRVAVVDDAVRTTHQDLSANLLAGRDVANGDNDPNPPAAKAGNFSWSHGTHCAGIVSAVTNNGVGIAAIGYNVRLIPVKTVPDSEEGKSLPFAVEGVQWASQQNPRPDVISMSWVGPGASITEQTFFQNVANLGILLVAAAGNSSTSSQHYPAAYSSVVAVAATGQTDAKASFSNFGSWVNISAPGVGIYSTVAGSGGSNSSYESYDGTSMACPLVSGLLALAKSYKPTATNAEILSCLYSSADNINAQNPNFVGQLGAGRINAFAMLQCLGAAAPVACSGQLTFTATSGSLTDGSGGNDYNNDADCS